MKVLVTIVGPNDPWVRDKESGPRIGEKGPILNVVSEIGDNFDNVVLLHDHNTTMNAEATIDEIGTLLCWDDTNERVFARRLNVERPNDFIPVLSELRSHIDDITRTAPEDSYSMVISSGTNVMHICWIMLAMSGNYDGARYFRSRNPRRIEDGGPLVQEVRFDDSGIPDIFFPPEAIKSDRTETEEELLAMAKKVGICGSHKTLLDALGSAAKIAQTDMTVLIRGETGTGKELFAEFIRRFSKKPEPYVPVNCGAITPSLMMSELFGHEKGAFSGAIALKKGRFESAKNGTLFLDEVGDFPMEVQAALLRALPPLNEIQRVGSEKRNQHSARVIAATNKNLDQMVREGTFREDLLGRFATRVGLPPLRNRGDDVYDLTNHFRKEFNLKYGKNKLISKRSMRPLREYHWPRNVRELSNFVEHAVCFCDGDVVSQDYLAELLSELGDKTGVLEMKALRKKLTAVLPEPHPAFHLRDVVDAVEEVLVNKAFNRAGSTRKAAQFLHISKSNVDRILKRSEKKTC